MITETLRRIVQVPEEYAKQNRSTACLLEDIGFPEARDALKTKDVEQLLGEQPKLVGLWIKRGNDQRFAGGWGIESLSGEHRVVCYADGRKTKFDDKFLACADFVVRYLCFIGEVQAKTKGRTNRRRSAA